MPSRRAVGTNVLRKEGFDKVTGRARYLDDLSFPNLLYGRTIRSTIPSGDIARVHCDFDRRGFTIVDYHDVPGRNLVALIEDDQPCLAERIVRHVAEPILLLAHADREQLAAATVTIDYHDSTGTFADGAQYTLHVPNYVVSSARLREAGFTAKRSLDDGIRELLKGYRMCGRGMFRNAG